MRQLKHVYPKVPLFAFSNFQIFKLAYYIIPAPFTRMLYFPYIGGKYRDLPAGLPLTTAFSH